MVKMVKIGLKGLIINGLLIGIASVYSGVALCRVVRHTQMSSMATAEVQSTSVQKVGSDRFELWVNYSFPFGEGEGALPQIFRNEISANTHTINNLNVWYNPKRPEQSTLRHQFPLKSCIYALILLGLATYNFVLQKIYIRL